MTDIYYGDNDHSLQLIGLMNEATQAYENGATVQGRILDGPAGTEIAGLTFPLTMTYVDPTTDTVGGEAGGETIIKSVSGSDLIVTVGTTNNLTLAAGRFIRALHSDVVWRVVLAATGTATQDATIHVDPVIWPQNSSENASKPGNMENLIVGEVIEIVDGTYSGTLDKALQIVKGTTYYAEVTAVAGALDGQWLQKLKGAYRLP
jgi:hypothetical protein